MIKHKNNETWNQDRGTENTELGKSDGGIGGHKNLKKNKN